MGYCPSIYLWLQSRRRRRWSRIPAKTAPNHPNPNLRQPHPTGNPAKGGTWELKQILPCTPAKPSPRPLSQGGRGGIAPAPCPLPPAPKPPHPHHLPPHPQLRPHTTFAVGKWSGFHHPWRLQRRWPPGLSRSEPFERQRLTAAGERQWQF